jgi:hypothetical protein
MTATDFFAQRYRNKSTPDLVQIAAAEDDLVPEAREALRFEIARRPQLAQQAPAPTQATASAKAPAPAEDNLDGVRGWLFVYCLSGIVACIRSTIATVTMTINGGLPLVVALIVLGIIVFDVATIVAIFVCARSALRMVFIQLLLSAAAIALVFGAQIASLLTSIESEGTGVLILKSVFDVAGILIWYRYFCVSKRVRITFGRNL